MYSKTNKISPLKRFYNLLSLDKKDVYQILFYAIFSGLISLSLPLGIQAIINFIQSGRVSVSWIVLIFVVVVGVAFGGILSLMQLRITENLQQKIFIRSSFDFAFRLPKIKFEALSNYYPPELANRFFDTLTIQKGTSKLLIDFSAALLQITFGVLLLSFYHPFFIVFGLMLIILLYLIFKFSYASGLETSLKESEYKYKIAAWLQEIARNHVSFKNPLHHDFSMQKNDTYLTGYVNYREQHFNVIKKQYIQLIGFKMLITLCLLSIGGYLVLNQQMNIGQFVAAEIIILLVINSVEKIILGLETFYDVLTSVEKIGKITDMPMEEGELEDVTNVQTYDNIILSMEDLTYKFPNSDDYIINGINITINQNEKVFFESTNGSGKTTLFRIMAGIIEPTSGSFFINNDTFLKINLNQYRLFLSSYIDDDRPFEGSILENITLNNPNITHETLKWALNAVQLTSFIKSLPEGIETRVFPNGKKLSASNAQKIVLARCIIQKPKILVLKNPTDQMDTDCAKKVIDFILSEEHNWTVIVASKNEYWKNKCQRHVTVDNGILTLDRLNN